MLAAAGQKGFRLDLGRVGAGGKPAMCYYGVEVLELTEVEEWGGP